MIIDIADYRRLKGETADFKDYLRAGSTRAGQLENWLHGLHPVIDGLLAASAKVRGWTLVTRHPADLARTDVTLHNPFRPN